ncbi:Uncharacterized protein BP5553_04966 [Venustampulla echinocandica]|uniref:Uncharacterized protein n=1 Tax=Venustampulla echinocandica TaxID=2656787 RepID=A0A370TPT8_9HELO|nr:Uncharacterized protein BP5553_04966 [Venustampulla echinocandica]RDL37533.1 Uncharacterized protein BP5553_04966 [Venustampulla echinocandica]
MAQGTVKLRKSTASTGRRPSALGPKKGARTIAPKRQVLVRNAKMTKKHSSGLISMTERTLGSKAGHLELLKGGKKNKDKKEAEEKKGGSKKFG